MAKRKNEFPGELRRKLLLWCDRHCCLCRKQCDVRIEIHHLDPAANSGLPDEDNAIPLCFDCHAKVGHYNSKQPKGNKIGSDELRQRREQVYDEFTRHLVPRLDYRMAQGLRALPDAGFVVQHLGGPPARLRISIDIYLDGVLSNAASCDPLYRGEYLWNLNPGNGVQGHLNLVPEAVEAARIHAAVNIDVVDVYERTHKLLPVTWVLEGTNQDWWLDPVDPNPIRMQTWPPLRATGPQASEGGPLASEGP